VRTSNDKADTQEYKSKRFERSAKELRNDLDEGPDTDFKIAIFQALQHLEQFSHPNNLIALSLLEHAVACYRESQDDQARLLLYVSGATINASVANNLLVAIRALTAPTAGN
jgi:hypothetical protein